MCFLFFPSSSLFLLFHPTDQHTPSYFCPYPFWFLDPHSFYFIFTSHSSFSSQQHQYPPPLTCVRGMSYFALWRNHHVRFSFSLFSHWAVIRGLTLRITTTASKKRVCPFGMKTPLLHFTWELTFMGVVYSQANETTSKQYSRLFFSLSPSLSFFLLFFSWRKGSDRFLALICALWEKWWDQNRTQ